MPAPSSCLHRGILIFTETCMISVVPSSCALESRLLKVERPLQVCYILHTSPLHLESSRPWNVAWTPSHLPESCRPRSLDDGQSRWKLSLVRHPVAKLQSCLRTSSKYWSCIACHQAEPVLHWLLKESSSCVSSCLVMGYPSWCSYDAASKFRAELKPKVTDKR